jgi:hypothetical protein
LHTGSNGAPAAAKPDDWRSIDLRLSPFISNLIQRESRRANGLRPQPPKAAPKPLDSA